MRTKFVHILSLVILFQLNDARSQESDSVYFTSGFKIGEVTKSSVVIWTRLCKSPAPVPVHHERKSPAFQGPVDFDNDMPVNKMDGAVEGLFGQVKIRLASNDTIISTDWKHVSVYKDFTIKEKITGLSPNEEYTVTVSGRKNENSGITVIKGKFKTAPSNSEAIPVTFTSTSCQYFWDFDDPVRGFKIYDSMLKLNPLFHCQTGDYVYYDKSGPDATNIELARHKWHANNSWLSLRDFYAQTPIYQQKDDHDMLKDDAFPSITPFGELTFEDGLSIWREQVPIIGNPYRTFRWGKDLQIWVVEGREFRTDNREPDGENKSIWGEEQKAWFTKTVSSSDATFKILISPTPVIGPDRAKGKNDNHSNNAFRTEGEWLRKYLAEHEVFVINGDRHWQYVSVDPNTGAMEFSQGPSSDSHAQGWKQEDVRPEHKFLRVCGGFLAVEVYRKRKPIIKFTHYDVDGNKVHEEEIRK